MTVHLSDIFLLFDHYWSSYLFYLMVIIPYNNGVFLWKKILLFISLKGFLWKSRILSTARKSTCWTIPVARNWNTLKRLDSKLDAMMYRWSVLFSVMAEGKTFGVRMPFLGVWTHCYWGGENLGCCIFPMSCYFIMA